LAGFAKKLQEDQRKIELYPELVDSVVSLYDKMVFFQHPISAEVCELVAKIREDK
jgi:hypothetical protein